MVEAGEASGGLAEILGKVALYFESTVRLVKKVKSAMTYPIAVIGLAGTSSAALVATDLNDGGTDTGFTGGWTGSNNVFRRDFRLRQIRVTSEAAESRQRPPCVDRHTQLPMN